MKELIKLIDKDFFPEFKKPLTEATGLNIGSPLPGSTEGAADEDLIQTLPVDDTQWNDLFKKYLNPGYLKYFIITVNGFKRKEGKEIAGEPSSGYIKYVGDSQQEQKVGWKGLGKGFLFLPWGKKTVNSVDSKDIEIITNEDEATIFTSNDVDNIIDGIKRNPDFSLKGAEIKKQLAKGPTLDAADLANRVLMAYFNKLCGSDSLASKLRPALGIVNNICRKRNSPLVGNPLLDVLEVILKTNPSFNCSTKAVATLNDIMAKRILEPEDILAPRNIKASLCYNDKLYDLGINGIKQLFDVYNEVTQMSGDFTLPGLAKYNDPNGKGKVLVAKNLLFQQDSENDPFPALLEGREDVELQSIGYKPEGIILTSNIRKPESVVKLKDAILKTNKTTEEGKVTRYYLYVGKDDPYQLKNVEDAEGFVTGRFENVEFEKDQEIKVTKNAWNSDNLLFILIKNHADKFNKDIFEIKEGKLFVKESTAASVEIEVKEAGKNTYVTEFKLTDVTLSGEGETETEETTTTEEEPTETEETTEKVPDGYEEVDPDGTTVGEEQQNVTVQVGDKVVGLDGNRLDVTAENIGGGKWNIKAGTKIWRKKAETTPEETPEETTTTTIPEGSKFESLKEDNITLTEEEQALADTMAPDLKIVIFNKGSNTITIPANVIITTSKESEGSVLCTVTSADKPDVEDSLFIPTRALLDINYFKKVEDKPTETPTPTTTPSENAFVGGKSLDDISNMSKDDFKVFASNLTPEDKAKLKALGGKLLAAK